MPHKFVADKMSLHATPPQRLLADNTGFSASTLPEAWKRENMLYNTLLICVKL